jgi:hypothetical protein
MSSGRPVMPMARTRPCSFSFWSAGSVSVTICTNISLAVHTIKFRSARRAHSGLTSGLGTGKLDAASTHLLHVLCALDVMAVYQINVLQACNCIKGAVRRSMNTLTHRTTCQAHSTSWNTFRALRNAASSPSRCRDSCTLRSTRSLEKSSGSPGLYLPTLVAT